MPRKANRRRQWINGCERENATGPYSRATAHNGVSRRANRAHGREQSPQSHQGPTPLHVLFRPSPHPRRQCDDIKNKSFKITAKVEVPESGAEGVIATRGGRFNGWGLYLLAGKLTFHYNFVGVERTTVTGPHQLATGSRPSSSISTMTDPDSAKAAPPRSSQTARQSSKVKTRAPSRFASRRTRRWASAKTPVHR